jgi:hypothetical protein
MFRRRSKHAADPPSSSELRPDPAESAEPPEGSEEGPWDAADAPDDGLTRVDLGGLRVPAAEGVELRVEADAAGTVAGVLLAHGASTLALGAFAAPRTQGIWDDVRAELLESVRADGGNGSEREGSFGPELAATVVSPEGRQAVRFVGVDGPCWFLRGVFTGPAATDPTQAATLERAMRQVVVSRGGEALPVRDPLPLVLPAEVLEQAADEASRSAPAVPERGPEITETR